MSTRAYLGLLYYSLFESYPLRALGSEGTAGEAHIDDNLPAALILPSPC